MFSIGFKLHLNDSAPFQISKSKRISKNDEGCRTEVKHGYYIDITWYNPYNYGDIYICAVPLYIYILCILYILYTPYFNDSYWVLLYMLWENCPGKLGYGAPISTVINRKNYEIFRPMFFETWVPFKTMMNWNCTMMIISYLAGSGGLQLGIPWLSSHLAWIDVNLDSPSRWFSRLSFPMGNHHCEINLGKSCYV